MFTSVSSMVGLLHAQSVQWWHKKKEKGKGKCNKCVIFDVTLNMVTQVS